MNRDQDSANPPNNGTFEDRIPYPVQLPSWVGYVATLAFELALTAGLLELYKYFPLGNFPIPYVLVIMLVAYVFGEGPAVFAFFLGLLAFDYYFTPPARSIWPLATTPTGWASVVAYFIGTSIVGFSMILIRRSRKRAQRLLAQLEAELRQRMQTEARLREIQDDLNRAQAVAHTGSWRLDIRRNELKWSDETYRIFGIPLGTPMTYETFLATVHPEDREYVDWKWQEALRGKPYDIEHRIIVGAEVKWIRERAELELDADGNVLGGFGTAQDITDRKRYEEALEASESNYRAIFDAANDAIFIHNAETGQILDVNLRMSEMYGYSADEARRLSVVDLSAGEPPYSQENALSYMRKAVEGEPQLFEWRAKAKDGRLFWVEVNLKRAVIGRQICLLALVRDITERKLAAQRERELEAEKLDFYRRTIVAATDGKLVIAEPSEIETAAGPATITWDVRVPEDVPAVRHSVEDVARNTGIDENRISKFVIAVGEAVTNAVKHAGGGTVSLHKAKEGLILKVVDHGPGIPALALPEVALRSGYSTAGTLGMGYKVMISFADTVYLATGPAGTTVAVEVKYVPVPHIPLLLQSNTSA